jgi:hypothetical protein
LTWMQHRWATKSESKDDQDREKLSAVRFRTGHEQ